MKKLITLSIFFVLASNAFAQKDTVLYSFFSAGHVYGNPNNTHYSLHYPFVDYIPTINNYPKMELGFLTGDVVVSPTAAYWDSAMMNINKLNMPVYIAAGNHDIGAEFEKRFEKYYQDFIYKNDLFIILTPGLNSWNISGDQLTFLQKSLDSNHTKVNNIFIFLHELIWWSPTNEYKYIDINYTPHYPGSTNFEDVVKPLLLSYPNKITLFAGDLGATSPVTHFMYHKFNNITLIGSGMGGGIQDNIIITNVYADSVYFDLVSINNSDPNSLGELADFDVINSINSKLNNSLNIFPNPISDVLYVENNSSNDVELSLFNLNGLKLFSTNIKGSEQNKFNFEFLESGVYLIQSIDGNQQHWKKIIIK